MRFSAKMVYLICLPRSPKGLPEPPGYVQKRSLNFRKRLNISMSMISGISYRVYLGPIFERSELQNKILFKPHNISVSSFRTSNIQTYVLNASNFQNPKLLFFHNSNFDIFQDFIISQTKK